MVKLSSVQSTELPILDFQQLKNLEELSDADESIVGELRQIFSSTTPLLLVQLRNAILDNERESIRRIAHRLKGSAANIGARQMADLCHALEIKAKSDSLEISLSECTLLEEMFKSSEQALDDWLKQAKV